LISAKIFVRPMPVNLTAVAIRTLMGSRSAPLSGLLDGAGSIGGAGIILLGMARFQLLGPIRQIPRQRPASAGHSSQSRET